MKKESLKISENFDEVIKNNEENEDGLFISGSEPFMLALGISFILSMMVFIILSLILEKSLTFKCEPDAVLYSAFIVGVLTVILSVGLFVLFWISVGFDKFLLDFFGGICVSGLIFVFISILCLIPIYGRVFLIPVCR